MGSEWPLVRLGDVVDLTTGFPFASQQYTDDPTAPRLLRGDNVGQGAIRWDGAKRWPAPAADGLDAYWLREGDVILAMDRPWIEAGLKYAYVRQSDLPALLVQRVARLRGSDRLDTGFLRYVIAGRGFTDFVTGIQTGTAVPHISGGQIQGYRFPLPPLAEQRRIAGILSALDDKIELNRLMSQTLESMARALFKSWFVDFDPVRAKSEGLDTGLPDEINNLFTDTVELSDWGEIPCGWQPTALGDLCEKPQYGFTASATDQAVGPRFLRITDINKRPWIEWASVPYCEASETERRQYRVKPGDVLIARMADPGHGVMIEEDTGAVFASYLIRFRPIDHRYDRFLQYWLRSDDYWSLVEGYRTGTTRASLNAQVLSAFRFVLPPPALADAFGIQVSALRSSLTRNVSESTRLSEARDQLLQRLIGRVQSARPDERIWEGQP